MNKNISKCQTTFLFFFLLFTTIITIINTQSTEFKDDESSFSFSRLPLNSQFNCSQLNLIASQNYLISFEKDTFLSPISLSIQKLKQYYHLNDSNSLSKVKGTEFSIDLSSFYPSSFTIINLLSNNIDCQKSSSSSLIVCNNTKNINNFTISYTMSLNCSYYCLSFNDSSKVFNTPMKLKQPSLSFTIIEKDTLFCQCIPTPIPPAPTHCQNCYFNNTRLSAIVVGGKHKAFIQTDVNVISTHTGCCELFHNNIALNTSVFVGNFTKHFESHWLVSNTTNANELSELFFTLPFDTDNVNTFYSVKCCSGDLNDLGTSYLSITYNDVYPINFQCPLPPLPTNTSLLSTTLTAMGNGCMFACIQLTNETYANNSVCADSIQHFCLHVINCTYMFDNALSICNNHALCYNPSNNQTTNTLFVVDRIYSNTGDNRHQRASVDVYSSLFSPSSSFSPLSSSFSIFDPVVSFGENWLITSDCCYYHGHGVKGLIKCCNNQHCYAIHCTKQAIIDFTNVITTTKLVNVEYSGNHSTLTTIYQEININTNSSYPYVIDTFNCNSDGSIINLSVTYYGPRPIPAPPSPRPIKSLNFYVGSQLLTVNVLQQNLYHCKSSVEHLNNDKPIVHCSLNNVNSIPTLTTLNFTIYSFNDPLIYLVNDLGIPVSQINQCTSSNKKNNKNNNAIIDIEKTKKQCQLPTCCNSTIQCNVGESCCCIPSSNCNCFNDVLCSSIQLNNIILPTTFNVQTTRDVQTFSFSDTLSSGFPSCSSFSYLVNTVITNTSDVTQIVLSSIEHIRYTCTIQDNKTGVYLAIYQQDDTFGVSNLRIIFCLAGATEYNSTRYCDISYPSDSFLFSCCSNELCTYYPTITLNLYKNIQLINNGSVILPDFLSCDSSLCNSSPSTTSLTTFGFPRTIEIINNIVSSVPVLWCGIANYALNSTPTDKDVVLRFTVNVESNLVTNIDCINGVYIEPTFCFTSFNYPQVLLKCCSNEQNIGSQQNITIKISNEPKVILLNATFNC